MRVRFFVFAQTQEPAIGAPAPRTVQPVLRDVAQIEDVDTSLPPDPALHTLTVAEAIDLGKPVVVAFATPRFCQTQTCGPVLSEAVLPVAARFGDRISVVHIEPFDLEAVEASGQLVPVPALQEWGLDTEPRVFVPAADGTVAAKIEGITGAEELGGIVAGLLEERG